MADRLRYGGRNECWIELSGESKNLEQAPTDLMELLDFVVSRSDLMKVIQMP